MTFWGGIESRSSVRNGTQVGLEAYIPESERVLCFSVHLLYEAECVKTAKEDKQVSGWNKNSGFWKAGYSNMWTAICRQWELQEASQEHYAECKMRGDASGKKTSGLQQKNDEVRPKNKLKQSGMEMVYQWDTSAF